MKYKWFKEFYIPLSQRPATNVVTEEILLKCFVYVKQDN